ncbi:MAG TPA: NAD(P)H-hydrate dehydratase [Ktedonobacterales bacterium]|nr:NAD(P)H-hydrate dehydratase [Ktedonobacterales bacterium]
MRVISVDEMREIERRAEVEYGLTSPLLMEHAGRSVAEILAARLGGEISGMEVVVLIGPGNNGGDGRVMARHLAQMGAKLTLFDWKTRQLEQFSAGALVPSAPMSAAPVITPAGDDLAGLRDAVARADVVVDALLGTGHSRPLDPTMRAALDLARAEHARRRQLFILAVDLPSGLNADTGALDEGTLAADLTVTLAFPKTGLFLFPGAEAVGELVVGEIGLPPEMSIPPGLELLDAPLAHTLLPKRPLDSNKGTYGKVMVVAGSPSFLGAAYLAAAAAAHVGAGLVTLATTPERAQVYAIKMSEATYCLLPPDAADPRLRAQTVLEGLAGYRSLVIGPGLSQASGVRPFVEAIFAGLRSLPDDRRPRLIVDADALNALATRDHWWEILPPQSVLTPHPGEMARLRGGETVSSGGPDRLAVARECAQAWGHVVVLKGACTLIASPEGSLRVNWPPNPALATAGTGDVLSGAIGGLLAQGLAPFDAASAAVHLHSRAGLRVSERIGDAGLLAGDLLPELPCAIAEVRGA